MPYCTSGRQMPGLTRLRDKKGREVEDVACNSQLLIRYWTDKRGHRQSVLLCPACDGPTATVRG